MPNPFTPAPIQHPVVLENRVSTLPWTLYYQQLDRVFLGVVSGPASATDTAIARFDGVTGTLIQNSLATLSDAGRITATEGVYVASTSSSPDPGDVTGPALFMGYAEAGDYAFLQSIETGIGVKTLNIQPIGGITAFGGGIGAGGLPTSSAGLAAGFLWVDTGAGNVVKRV